MFMFPVEANLRNKRINVWSHAVDRALISNFPAIITIALSIGADLEYIYIFIYVHSYIPRL